MLFSPEKPLLQVPLRDSGIIDRLAHSSSRTFCSLAASLIPWLAAAAAISGTVGLYLGLFITPVDAQHGEVYRVIFIHVPAAWVSMFIFVVMAFWSGVGLAFNTRLSTAMTQALAPTGAMFAFLALWTGSLWGKPAWGVWWAWDVRLASELILLFLYLGFMVLQLAVDDARRAAQAGAVLALIGVIDISIIYSSVQWWSTLPQDASVSLKSAPEMAATSFAVMAVMAAGIGMYSVAVTLSRARCIILERERDAEWVTEYVRRLT